MSARDRKNSLVTLLKYQLKIKELFYYLYICSVSKKLIETVNDSK